MFDARWKSVTSYTRPFFSRNESADAHVHKVVSNTPAPICLPSYYTKVFPSLGAHRIYDDISFSQPQTQHQTALWQIKTKSSRSLLISTKSPLSPRDSYLLTTHVPSTWKPSEMFRGLSVLLSMGRCARHPVAMCYACIAWRCGFSLLGSTTPVIR